jgi:energy-dependent translational throttle protein EttA
LHGVCLMGRAAKGKKDKGGSGGGAGGGGGGGGKFKSPGEVKEGAAYAQETRKTILTMQKLNKVTPQGKQLLKGVSLGIYLGAKIGILGANGAGKSTLMKILAGVDTAFDGDVNVQKGLRVGYLPQEPQLADGDTVWSNIEPALKEMKDKIAEFEQVSADMANPDADIDALMSKMERLQAEIDAANGWEIDRTVERAMDALRCPPGEAQVKVLSGGERRRVALCRLLLSNPQMLLLDEPTNHLDAQSVAWLERFLGSFPGTVVAVTHDRYFLDNTAGWILELDRGQGIPFEGNYSSWVDSKNKRLASEAAAQSARDRALAAEAEFLSKARAGQAKKGKARLRAYDDLLEQSAAYVRNSTLDGIIIPIGPRLGNQVIDAKSITKGFPDRGLLMDGLTFSVPPGAVVGIVGGNGAGKSTLFRMIMGQDKPDSGDLIVGQTVKLMCVDQSRDSLDESKSVYETLSVNGDEVVIGGRAIPARAYASWFNFKGGDQQKRVGDLSGGERNRLHLASTLLTGGNTLLLDEPSNDLDLDTLRCLEDAINSFAGTTLVISHDRFFLDRLATHILAFEGDSNVVWFEGSWSEYDADRKRRTGVNEPTRLKYRPMPALA